MRRGQSRRMSVVESWANIVVGFAINYTANMLIFPLFGWQITHAENFGLGLIFTAISFARSYAMRRAFNWIWERAQ